MRIGMRLTLPRDARYVPVLRSVAGCVLESLGAPSDDVADIQLAITEACANVVRHAAGTEEYTVGVSVTDGGCEIEAIDLGPGFDADPQCPDDDAETGRGLFLMRTLVDDLEFVADTEATRIVLRKRWSVEGLDLQRGQDASGAEAAAAAGIILDRGPAADGDPTAPGDHQQPSVGHRRGHDRASGGDGQPGAADGSREDLEVRADASDAASQPDDRLR